MIIGIDPGKQGGIAYISPAGEIAARPMPIIGKDVDGGEIASQLKALLPDIVIIEKSQAMPGQGVTSMFNYGVGFGRLLGVIEALGIPYRLVTPQAWKKVVLAGTAKDKSAAVSFVRHAFPAVNLTPGQKRLPHDGMADALCIAEYGRQLMTGGNHG
ncbi:MAG: Holliday junction endonuclease [Pseudomonadota bacterium]